ncbi:MAG: histidine kinase, partial [Gemmatimonadaceae bacterium]|nr:histidine kinase [Chitinophagaceae bacterium]
MRKSLPDILKRVGIHILFWLIVVLYFGWGFGYKVNFGISLLNAAFYLPGFMLLVYSLLYYLIPKFLIKRNYLQFFAGYLLVLCICAAYAYITDLKVKAIDDLKAISLMTGRAFLPFIHVSGSAISIKLLDYWYKQKQKTAEVQQEKLLTELELIKSQIHPHFLFNTLNNLYSYTLEQSDKAPE